MWLFEAFAEDFGLPTEEWRVQLFRALLGSAVFLKFADSFRHGGWGRYEQGAFARYRLVSRRPALGDRLALAYKPFLVLRCFPALFVCLGLAVRLSLFLTMACLAVELVYDKRKHPVYFILNCAWLLFAGDPGELFRLSPAITASNTWAQGLIMITTWHIYWNSAWLKCRSAQFRSGRVLKQISQLAHRLDGSVLYREYCFPVWAWRMLARETKLNDLVWRGASAATIVLEIILPIGLATARLHLVFCCVGVIMHALFTSLKPRAIAPFSIVTVASYLSFVG